MSSKTRGILFGLIAVVAGVVINLILSALLGLISGYVAMFMVYGFVVLYRKQNPNNKGKIEILLGFLFSLVGAVLSELIVIALIASTNGVSIPDVFAIEGMTRAVIIDIALLGVFLLIGVGMTFLDDYFKNKKIKQMRSIKPSQTTNSTTTTTTTTIKTYAEVEAEVEENGESTGVDFTSEPKE